MNVVNLKMTILSIVTYSVLSLYCSAQLTELYTVHGDNASDALGVAVSGVGDVNGDGFADFVAGAFRNDNNGSDSGIARVYSGVDGTILYTFNGDSAGDVLGSSVGGAGDVNGDGTPDIVVGAPENDDNGSNSGMVRVYSGLDGSILYTFNGDSGGDQLGIAVSGAGDVNGDGFADIIAGARFDDNNGIDSGSARVFSGLNGAILYTFDGDSAGDNFGNSVSGAGNFNGDGFADLIVGARFADTINGVDSGSARVFSGLDGSILYTFDGDSAADQFGVSVSDAGDVNGDGFDDTICGAHLDDNNGTNSGSARVNSGADGSILHTFNGNFGFGSTFGAPVSGAGDVDGDGFADLLVGARNAFGSGFTSAGAARIFSGFDGSTIDTLFGGNFFDLFGIAVSAAGDVNGDGKADFIVGAFATDVNALQSGSVRVVTSNIVPPTMSLGQAPQAGLAVFDINNATNDFGLPTDSGVVVDAAKGPYATSIVGGGVITFSWSGVPLTGLTCLFGSPNDAISNFPGVGSLDIGALPLSPSGIPSALFVFGDFNLSASSFHHAQFFCGVNGTGFVSYQLSPIFPPGFLTRFQCLMNPAGQFFMSNAVDVTVL